jgi:AcrR family transcriptional regulator
MTARVRTMGGRTLPAQTTPERILAAAEARFARHGYTGARLVDITADAGMTTGALYRYFPGKEDLPPALIDYLDEDLASSIGGATSRRAALEALTATLADHQGALRLLFERSTWQSDRLVKDPIHGATKALAPKLELDLSPRKAQEVSSFVSATLFHYTRAGHDGGLDPCTPETVAHVVNALLESGFYRKDAKLTDASTAPRDLPRFTPFIRWEPSADKALPRSPKGIRTRRAIQEAAARVFDRVGLAGASMNDIAEDAGVASGSAYRYFVDKADVLRSMQAEVEEAIIRESHLPLDRGRLSFRAQMLAYLACYERHLGSIRAWLDLAEPGTDMAAAWNGMRAQFIDRVVKILQHGVQNGIARADLDLVTVAQVHSIAYEAAAYGRYMRDQRQTSPSQLAETMERLFIGGFSGSQS